MKRSSPGHAQLAVALAVASLPAFGCGERESPPATGGEGTVPPPPPFSCPRGSIESPAGDCMAVGIQGCADLFIEEDGLCHPTIAKCPPGQIPRFDEGCVSVGIPRCAPEFLEEDGLCHPTLAKCPEGTFAVPQEGCVPIDGPDGCGVDPWANIPDEPGNVHVDPSFPDADGDGSRARPLKTIGAALAAVAPGGRIALAAGIYDGPVVITKPVELAGRCPSKVRVQRLDSSGEVGIIVIKGAHDVTIRGVEIGGATVGVAALGGADVLLERVHVKNATANGVGGQGTGSRLTISHGWIEGTLPGAASEGPGAAVFDGASLTVTASAITGNVHAGALSSGTDTEAHVIDSLIEGTLSLEGDQPGPGVVAAFGGHATLEQSAIVGSDGLGVFSLEAHSAVDATEVLVEKTRLLAHTLNEDGAGVLAVRGGRVSVVSGVLSGNDGTGALSIADSDVTLTGSLVQQNGSERYAAPGGVRVGLDARLTLDGSALWHNVENGLLDGVGSDVNVTRSLIEGTLPRANGVGGFGVNVLDSRIALTSSAFVGNHAVAINVQGKDAEMTMTGCIVEGTLSQESTTSFGRGMQVSEGARATLDADVFDRNRDIAILLQNGAPGRTDLTVSGCLIENTTSRELDDEFGAGLFGEAATLDVASSIFRNNRMAGVMLVHDAIAELTGTWVDGVPGGRFSLLTGEHVDGAGDGVIVMKESAVSLIDVHVTGCSRAGILYDDSSGNITAARATRNGFGLVVQGAPQPTVAEDCAFLESTAQDRVVDGSLLVPAAPPSIP